MRHAAAKPADTSAYYVNVKCISGTVLVVTTIRLPALNVTNIRKGLKTEVLNPLSTPQAYRIATINSDDNSVAAIYHARSFNCRIIPNDLTNRKIFTGEKVRD
jgi:hypothetical protein